MAVSLLISGELNHVTPQNVIKTLNEDNYRTWKMQIEAWLVLNDAWGYVNGAIKIPSGDAATEESVRTWKTYDAKATACMILSIRPSELSQVQECATSREVWLKLESIYRSKVPARKIALMKKLTDIQRMQHASSVREHVETFFDVVDKLGELDVTMNPKLVSLMLLCSLPSSFEEFRCAVSRDELPSPETLRVKIMQESEWRNITFANEGCSSKKARHRDNRADIRFRCRRCRAIDHKSCSACKKTREQTNMAG